MSRVVFGRFPWRSFAGHVRRHINSALHVLFLVVLVLAPLPLASNREWSWTLCALLIGCIGMLWSVGRLVIEAADPDTGSPDLHRRMSPLLPAGFLLVVAWALFQASMAAPDDWVHPLWLLGADMLGTEAAGAVSLAPDDTYAAAMRLLCYGLTFWLAFLWGRDELRARRTLKAIMLAALAYAVYGLIQFWSGSNTLFWFESPSFNHVVHSTFVNRNHFATYVGLALLCALGLFHHLVAAHRGGWQPPTAAGRFVPRDARATTTTDRLEQFAVLAWKPLLTILVLTTALILTNSRGGFLSTLAGGAVLLWCLNYRSRIRSRGSQAVIIAAAGIAAIAFWISSEALLERLDRKGLSDELRFSAYELITESAAENPLLGFGYGTFADSFRLYRSDEISGYLDRAHNTYLENVFELGWPAALLLFAALAGCVLICIRGLRNRGKDWVYPAVGISAATLAGIHAWFDFSLQMPAVAMTFAAILGTACAQSHSSHPNVGAT